MDEFYDLLLFHLTLRVCGKNKNPNVILNTIMKKEIRQTLFCIIKNKTISSLFAFSKA